MRYFVRRAGTKLDSYTKRGGLWFEIIDRELYAVTTNAFNRIFNNDNMHFAFVELNNPRYFQYDSINEANLPLYVFSKVFGMPLEDVEKDFNEKYKERFYNKKDINLKTSVYSGEEVISEYEKAVSNQLLKDGYDSAIIYNEVIQYNHLFVLMPYVKDINWL